MKTENRGGRPKLAPVVKKLPPAAVPIDVESAAREVAEYDGVTLTALVRKAVVLYTKTRQDQMKHA